MSDSSAPSASSPQPRLDALDNLRAMMMWLGIVLHVALLHLTQGSPVPWHDDRRTRVADVLLAFIHAFRMPVFFILAGFFMALLVQHRGVRGMLRNRMRRLALPLAVLWLPVFAAVILFAMLFLHRMVRGTWGLDPALVPPSPALPLGMNTMHLWFLWMLVWFSVITALVWEPLARLPGTRKAASWLAAVGGAWWGFALLALPLAAVGVAYPNGILVVRGSLLPPPAEWLHYGLFFVFGLCLHQHQGRLFAHYQRRWGAYAAAGLVFFMLAGALIGRRAEPLWSGYSYNCASWLWSFALVGLVLRHLPQRRAMLAWLSASSYWVYIVHLPLTIAFGALLFGLPLPALVKMAINIAATTAICLISYELLVRRTWMGVLLGGRMPRAGPPAGLAAGL